MRERLAVLDGLRGVAALTVVLAHYLGAYEPIGELFTLPMESRSSLERVLLAIPYLLISGSEAVLLFFVLSGFVLALPYLEGAGHGYPRYFVRRFFRIYVPYLVITLVAALLVFVLKPTVAPDLSEFLNGHWRTIPNWGAVRAIALVSDATMTGVNPPIWSLEHEMRVSLVFPLIAVFVRRASWRIALVAAVWTLLVGRWVGLIAGLGEALATSVHYGGMFVLGAVLAKYRCPLLDRLRRLNPRARALLFLLGLLLYLWRWLVSKDIFTSDILVGVGACSLIMFALGSGWFGRVLSSRPIQWLGRVSYSLYLTHLVVLLSMVYAFQSLVPGPVLVVLAFPATLLIAELSYRLVEKPAQDIGRWLSRSHSMRSGLTPRPAVSAGAGIMSGPPARIG